MAKKSFLIQASNDKIWNQIELIRFLVTHQNKSIQLRLNPEAISATTLGLYDLLDCFQFKQIEIYTHNPFEKHHRYLIRHLGIYNFALEDGTSARSYWQWNHSKRFLTIFARPTAGRLGLAAYLLEYYQQMSYLHFSWQADADNLALYEIDKLLCYDSSMIELVGRLIDRMPLKVFDTSGYNKGKYDYNDQLTSLYQDTLVDIVVESHVLGKTFFPTEKTFRPMWAQRPFVCFGAINHLLYLRQMGFMTFSDYWDEDYDGYEGRDRFIRMKKVIDYVASRTESQLGNMFVDMKHVLEHNYKILSNKSFSKNVHQVD